jgi:hypothetical protein
MGLSSIPFYGAYQERAQQNALQPMQELQQASGVMGLMAAIQKQEQEKKAVARREQFRAELAALGPKPTQEQLTQVAAKYTDDPAKLLDIEQRSLDRAATTAATAEAARGRLQQEIRYADMMHQYRMAQARNDADRNAELARHNRETERLRGELNALTAAKEPAPKPVQTHVDEKGQLWEREPGGTGWRRAVGFDQNQPGEFGTPLSAQPKPQGGGTGAMKVVQDPSSPTGWSYQNPAGQKIVGAPAPRSGGSGGGPGGQGAPTDATLDSVRTRVQSMTKKLQENSFLVGPAGVARKVVETGVGVVQPDIPTPAIDYNNELKLLVADVRKVVERDPNLSNEERRNLHETLGGGVFQTPGSAVRALNNVLEYVENKRMSGPGRDAKIEQQIPPPAQRVKDRVYQTPRGPMKWTGTGWLPGN